MDRVRRGKGVPSHFNHPDYELWPCPLNSVPKDEITLADIKRCPHPDGFHDWVERNPWIFNVKMPRKNNPSEDDSSCDEVCAAEFGFCEAHGCVCDK